MTELQTYWQGGPVILKQKKGMTKDGYTIKSQGGKTVISAANDAGLLYGAYHLLRLQQQDRPLPPSTSRRSPSTTCAS